MAAALGLFFSFVLLDQLDLVIKRDVMDETDWRV